VGPRAGLDMVVREKNLNLCQEYNPGHPAHSLATMLTELLQLFCGGGAYLFGACLWYSYFRHIFCFALTFYWPTIWVFSDNLNITKCMQHLLIITLNVCDRYECQLHNVITIMGLLSGVTCRQPFHPSKPKSANISRLSTVKHFICGVYRE
jgi:hypothetical protein